MFAAFKLFTLVPKKRAQKNQGLKRNELFHWWFQALASEDPVPGCFGGGNPESGERDGFFGHITRTEENGKEGWLI